MIRTFCQRRSVCALAVLLFAASAPLATAQAAPSPAARAAEAKDELRELKERIETIQQRVAEAEENKDEAVDALRASEQAISEASRAVAALSERLRAAQARVADIRRERERIEREFEKQQKALADTLHRQYTAGRPEALSVLLNGRDPNAISRELQYLTYIGRARAEITAELRRNAARLDELNAAASQQATELAALAAEQVRQRERLEQQKKERTQVLQRISRQIAVQRREIGTLKQDEARLSRLIDELAKAIARAARPRTTPAPAPRPKPSREGDPPTVAEPAPEPENLPSGDFAKLRGRLSAPVKGELANRFGSPRQGGGLLWKGLFIAARAGEEVRAIAGGRVVFADWLRGFGNLLIIDHGDSYMSLYGYNETLFKQVGDTVRQGERVAAVGSTGGQGNSGLYFEMRHEGRPFDPSSWVKLR